MASIKNLEIELNDKLVKRITELEQEKFHYDSLMDCCTKLLDSVDA